ncbi:MAG TPA: M23 family metallopeptidase [Bacillales bacterium]|nr:M23 family metallopeptidase [Bacillales bacterium]
MKKDEKQSTRQENMPKWRKFARKRWVYPAVYLGLAAIVIASVLWMQTGPNEGDYSIDPSKNGSGEKETSLYNQNKDAVPVNTMKEQFQWPVKDRNAVTVQKPFYDYNASLEDQQAALVLNDHTYRPNTGINLSTESGKSFAVTASLSGTVLKAEEDPELGYVVKVDNGDGVTTIYSSLKSTAVEKGDKVEQGDKIGMAGQSDYFEKAGVIVHFEIRKDGKPVNPVSYFGQSKAELLKSMSDDTNKDKKQDDSSSATDEPKQQKKQDEAPKNDETSNETSNNA